MHKYSKVAFYFLLSLQALTASVLAVSLNKISELIHTSLVGAIVIAIASLSVTIFLTIKLLPYQSHQEIASVQFNKVESARTLPRLMQDKIRRSIVCGISGLIGGLIWFKFGVIGWFVGSLLTLIGANVIKKFKIVAGHEETFFLCTLCITMCLSLEFAVATAILASGVPLFVNHVVVQPLVETTTGFLIAVAGGLFWAIEGALSIKSG